jgi:broad specificity phosphatase PhoE
MPDRAKLVAGHVERRAPTHGSTLVSAAVRTLIAVRHAEAGSNHAGTVNGVPPGDSLTAAGVEQARGLGRLLDSDAIDLVALTGFVRTAETAHIALTGRKVPRLPVPDFDEIAFGRFEGHSLSEYRSWAWAAPADEPCPGGGESRGQAAERYARGFAALLERPEDVVLLVAHALPIRYLLNAAEGLAPDPRVEPVPHAEPFRLDAEEVRRAAERLASWALRPVFR